MIAFSAVFLALAVLLFGLAYLIGVRGYLGLLAGYDPRRVSDPKGLARLAGVNLTIMAFASLAMCLAAFLAPQRIDLLAIAYVAVVLGSVALMIAQASRYTRT